MRWQSTFWQRSTALLVGQLLLARQRRRWLTSSVDMPHRVLLCTPMTPWPGRTGIKGAVAQARRDGKLLYISIGYFSCHY